MIHTYKKRNGGLTLVELLVAISILTIVTALLIPRLRIVNKDRNIREAARLVGSAFANARERAISNRTFAGVIIERNTNLVSTTSNGNRVFYAGTRLSQFEGVSPPFVGDGAEFGDFVLTFLATTLVPNDTMQCLIPVPLEHDPARGNPALRVNDKVTFGSGGNRPTFRVTNVLSVDTIMFMRGTETEFCGMSIGSPPPPFVPVEMLRFNIDFDDDLRNVPEARELNQFRPDFVTGQLPPEIATPAGNTSTFMMQEVNSRFCNYGYQFCQFTRTRSNGGAVDLPQGYVIDLRFSGPADPGVIEGGPMNLNSDDPDTRTLFGLALNNMADPDAPANQQIQFLFGPNGNLSQIGVSGEAIDVGQTMHLFINEIDPNEILDNTFDQAELLLNNAANLWVSIGAQGGTNIAYNTPPGINITNPQEIDAAIVGARSFSLQGASASQ